MSSTLKLLFTVLVIIIIALATYGAVTGAEQKAEVHRNAMLKAVPAGL